MAFKTSPRRLIAGIALAGTALALAGCQSGMTYGTGKSPGMQTVEDLAGIAVLGAPKNEPIDYKPRAGIVTPPNTAVLPPPGQQQTAALAANWPNDPDAQVAKIRADAAERERTGAPMPDLNLPQRTYTEPVIMPDPEKEAMGTPESRARAKKMFADARGGVAVDENGVPVRRYLSDPPSEYRMPDPNAPVEITEKPAEKRKFKWWWQK